MCNQTVGLVAAELERNRIPTVTIQLLRLVARSVGPPRSLVVPFRHGYPLDTPNDPERQHRVIDRALRMLEEAVPPAPVLAELPSA